MSARGVDSHSLRQPLGVVAGITPFNFPGHGADVDVSCRARLRQLLHPEAFGARSRPPSLRLAEWLKEAGLPDGVFNVVQGDKEAVDALLHHPDVAGRVASSARRRSRAYIYQTAALNGKRVAGARRRQEPHDRHAGRRSRPGGRRADGRRLRFGRRALHGDLGRRTGRRARRPTRSSSGCSEGPRAQDRARHRSRGRRWARSSRASTATRCAAISTGRRGRRRPASSTAAG